jgi:nitric oxide reductase NorQ protein
VDVQIERLGAADHAPDTNLKYVDNYKLHALFDKIAFQSNVILVGPKGIAKTLSVATWAAKHEHPIVTFDCSEDVRRSHLIGMFILRGDESPFILGPITTAIEIANEVGRCILCLEEVNALTPQMQKVLNPIGDFRRKVEVPECKRVFRLKPNAKLWLCGTMNTSVYGGVYELNEDLKSRFRMLPLDYPNKGQEQRVVKEVVGNGVPEKTVKDILQLAHETRQKALDYSLSTRDVVQIIEDIKVCGVEQALWLATGKFEGQERDFIKTRIESIFGCKVP